MTDLNDRMATELDTDREQLLAENDRLRAEVARLNAGIDDSLIIEGSMLTPGQWIARFLAADVHTRRDYASAAIETDRLAASCLEARHAALVPVAQHCIDQAHPEQLRVLWGRERSLARVTATITLMPDQQLHIEWTDRQGADWMLAAPDVIEDLVEKYNAVVRELADVAVERTAAWQAYADVQCEHQAEGHVVHCPACTGQGSEHLRRCPAVLGEVGAVLGELADLVDNVAARTHAAGHGSAAEAARQASNRLHRASRIAARIDARRAAAAATA